MGEDQTGHFFTTYEAETESAENLPLLMSKAASDEGWRLLAVDEIEILEGTPAGTERVQRVTGRSYFDPNDESET